MLPAGAFGGIDGRLADLDEPIVDVADQHGSRAVGELDRLRRRG